MQSERIFRSKIGLAFLLPLIELLGWAMVMTIIEEWLGVCIMGLTTAFAAYFFNNFS
jgi:hypothetical protein